MKSIDDINQNLQTRTTNTAKVVEALEKLSLQNIHHHDSSTSSSSVTKVSDSSSHHNQRLFDIARSIIGLNINSKDSLNVDYDDSTLIKLLQSCQTVIDLLLVEAKQSDYKNELNSQHNNLIQENAKLRKLLTLQQKAIAYRRVNYSGYNENLNSDLQSTATNAESSNLPEDSSHNNNNSGAKSTTTTSNQTFQCIYCPRVFNDVVSYSKHISLRHLASSLDDPSLSCNGSNGSISFVNYLQQRFQSNQLPNSKNLLPNNSNTELTDRLQEEICSLKEKLTQTQKALNEEKSARKHFETNLKSDFVQKVQQIQEQLYESISEIKFCRNEAQIAADLATNATRSCSEMVNSLKQSTSSSSSSPINNNGQDNLVETLPNVQNFPEINQFSPANHKPVIKRRPVVPKGLNRFDVQGVPNGDQDSGVPMESNVDSVISELQDQMKQKLQNEQQYLKKQKKKKKKLKPNLSESDSNFFRLNQQQLAMDDSSIQDISSNFERDSPLPEQVTADSQEDSNNNLKQNLKRQLITQLIKLKDENQNGVTNKVDDKVIEKNESKPKSNNNKVLKKMNPKKIISVIDTVVVPEKSASIDDRKELTKAEIYSSIESRLKSYLETDSTITTEINGQNSEKIPSTSSSSSSSSSLASSTAKSLDDETYLKAIEKFQRDRNLVIHQSRYDYDFVEIENTIRSLIDTKLQSKINETAAEFNRRLSIDESQMINGIEDNQQNNNRVDSVDRNLVETISQEEEEEEEDLEEDPVEEKEEDDFVLKSILKVNLKKKLKINEDNEPREPRKIKFSNELIEYEISPLQSDSGSFDVDDHDDYDPDEIVSRNNENQMFLINSSSPYTSDNTSNVEDYYIDLANGNNRPRSAAATTDFDGEKIYVNEFNSTSSSSTSSSSSDEDYDDRHSNIDDNKNNNNNQEASKVLEENQTKINVDVHVEPEPTQPIPAKRRTSVTKPTSLSLANSTLNSLLTLGDDQQNNNNDNDKSRTEIEDDDEELFRSKSLRVTELAELIEKKLQTQQRRQSSILQESTTSINVTEDGPNELNNNNSKRKLPPIGSVDMLAPLRTKSKQNGDGQRGTAERTANNDNPDDYDIYDF